MAKAPKEKPFEYADSPDGEDLLPKLWVTLKPAALIAFATSTCDVVLYSKPKGYLQILGRYLHFTWPILGVTTAFVVVQNMSGSWRGKDDKFNWFLGGAAAGGVLGVWRKNHVTGITLAMALGLAGVTKKYCIQNGFALIPAEKDVHTQYGGLRTVRQDWTLLKQRPGNWTTGQQ